MTPLDDDMTLRELWPWQILFEIKSMTEATDGAILLTRFYRVTEHFRVEGVVGCQGGG